MRFAVFLFLLPFWGQTLAQSGGDWERVFQLSQSGEWDSAYQVLLSLDTDTTAVPYVLKKSSLMMAVQGKRKTQNYLESELAERPPISEALDLREWKLLEVYCLRKNKKKAIPLFAKLNENPVSGSDSLKAFRYHATALYYQYIDVRPDLSGDAYLKTIEHYEPAGFRDPVWKGSVYRILGNGAQFNGKYDESLVYYGEEQRLYETNLRPDHPHIGIVHYNLGNTYQHLADPAQALNHYLQTYAVWKKNPPSERYWRFLLEAIGDMYFELGQEEEALGFYDLSTEGEPVVNLDESQALVRTADTLTQEGNLGEALPYYEKALAFRVREYGSQHPLTGACNNFIARTLARRGQMEQALQSYQKSLIILSDSFDSPKWQDNPPLQVLTGYEQYMIEALLGKGRLLLAFYRQEGQEGYLQAAHQCFDLAVAHIDQVRQTPISMGTQLFWSQFAYPAYELAIQSSLLLAQLHPNAIFLEQAFQYSEMSRAFLLLSAAQESEARQIAGLPTELMQQEAALQAGMREYRAKISREEQRCGDARPRNLELWRRKLLSLQTEYALYLQKVRTQYPEYHALKFQLHLLTLPELRQKLPENTMLLEYFVGDSLIYVMGLGAEVSEVQLVPYDDTLLHHLEAYNRLLRDPSLYIRQSGEASQQFSLSAHFLYQQLVKPLLVGRELEQLIIVSSGPLLQLPFEGMLTETPGTEEDADFRTLPYLFRDYQMRYAPSASVLFEQAAEWFGQCEAGPQTPVFLIAFYQAMSYLNQEPPNAELAIPLLEQVLEADSFYEEAAEWYLALAYLRENEVEQAKPLLKALQSGSYRATEATDLLNHLE